MSVWTKLFGSEKVVGGLVDGVYNGVDKLIFTDEEKMDNWRAALKLYEPFKLAQRLLALVFGVPYALAWLVTFVASFFLENIDAQLALLTGDMGVIVGAIVGFYFFGGAMSGGFGGIKSKGQ